MAVADPAFRRKQGVVVALSVAAAIVVAVVGLRARAWGAGWLPPADDPTTRLAFAARWLLAPGLALLAGIQVAASRGFHADAIDGTRAPASHYLEIALRYHVRDPQSAG